MKIVLTTGQFGSWICFRFLLCDISVRASVPTIGTRARGWPGMAWCFPSENHNGDINLICQFGTWDPFVTETNNKRLWIAICSQSNQPVRGRGTRLNLNFRLQIIFKNSAEFVWPLLLNSKFICYWLHPFLICTVQLFSTSCNERLERNIIFDKKINGKFSRWDHVYSSKHCGTHRY